jgi:RNA polymerase sigma-70 factor (ECF subfamily)
MPNIYATYSDKDLLSFLSKGDNRAFTEIYDRYWQKLLSVAVNKLDKDFALAEDQVQDLFIDIWNRRATMDKVNNLSGYLATAMKYKIIDARLKRSKTNSQVTTDAIDIVDHSTVEQLSFHELEERLAGLVQSLPEKCRLVYILSRETAWSQKEIAGALDISERTVESHVARALRIIRTGLNNLSSGLFL